MKNVRMPSGQVYAFEGNLLQTALRNGGKVVGEVPASAKSEVSMPGRTMTVRMENGNVHYDVPVGIGKILIEYGRAVEVEPETSVR
jgi:hypothetical protein